MNSVELFGRYATHSSGVTKWKDDIKLMDFDGFNKALGEILSLPVEAQVSQENGGLTLQQALLADKPFKRKCWNDFVWIRKWQREAGIKIFLEHITVEDILNNDWEVKG